MNLDDVIEMVSGMMRPYPRSWWIAGGWAVDCHAGRETRAHGDVDIMMDARDNAELFELLAGRGPRLRTSRTGEEEPWDGRHLPAGPYVVRVDVDGVLFEFLPSLFEGREWVFPRGSHGIRRDRDEFNLETPVGVPCAPPEVVLLYKSRQLVPKDNEDFATLLPVLSSSQRAWLAGTLKDDHPWKGELGD
ncbi:nucleotidyltransferase domain-containing protein [Parenemella sanctibonifatiensis]|uniref:Amino acid transporter n=1 Tax=Parenemella sanctibonifatiensis TaxID=2016505 RepID=A0A255EC74_9ACTN|nr:hypothetical protein [Parenemella sanctibonifatiensis]OYN89149.1 hypothetical protein CGZ91_12915 [Parenemella sanctibonifatiensis]